MDDVAGALATATRDQGLEAAVEKVVVHRGEITFFIRREHLAAVARLLRDDEALRFEFCSGVSGVHYPDDVGRELHAVYHLLSMTHNRRIRLEVTAPDADPHIPSVCATYPTADSMPDSRVAVAIAPATSSIQPPYGGGVAPGSSTGRRRPPYPEVSPVPETPNMPCRWPMTSRASVDPPAATTSREGSWVPPSRVSSWVLSPSLFDSSLTGAAPSSGSSGAP
jgi:hypothetical protein